MQQMAAPSMPNASLPKSVVNVARVLLRAEGHGKEKMDVGLHQEEHNYHTTLLLGRGEDGERACLFTARHWGWEHHTDTYEWDRFTQYTGAWKRQGPDAGEELAPGAYVLFGLQEVRPLEAGQPSPSAPLPHEIEFRYALAEEQGGTSVSTVALGAAISECVASA